MAKKNNSNQIANFDNPAKTIDEAELSEELSTSFLEYSYSVITDRALVDARDGLKPVHRRILWSMFDSGLSPEKAYVKSAKVVGDVMGMYHPHGDSAIYEALVRLAQDFNMMLTLADGKGNWGSPDDPPAASRYTEVKLDANALLLAGELKEDVVNMVPNYDGTKMQPSVLPVQYPNTLINGNVGIAVGMATKMPTHNPGEIMDAARWLLTHPNATLEKLMEFVPGPDFPTGGTLIGVDKIKEAYETGRGIFKIRGKASIESGERGKNQVVITELPYGVGAETIIAKAVELVKAQKIVGVSDIKDLTDRRQGTRIVFVVKAGVNPNAVLNELYRQTPLEVSFGINNTVLVDGRPKTLGLKELLQIFIDHRLEVVLRRSEFRRDKRKSRLHLVQGLLKVLLDIDKAIAIIRGSANSEEAKDKLIKQFKIDDIQASYVLDLQLRRLTKFDQHELEAERKRLESEIKELTEIIENDSILRKVVGDEMTSVKKLIDRPRLSEILDGEISEFIAEVKSAAQSTTFEIEDSATDVVLYSDGSIKRVDSGSKIKSFVKSGKNVVVMSVLPSRTRGKIVLVSNKGKGYRVDVLHLTDKPSDAKNLVGLEKDERILAISPVENAEGDISGGLGTFFATKNGTVKITNPDYPQRSDEFDLISIENGDEIVYARWVEKAEGAEIALLSSDSSLLRFPIEKLRPQGRSGSGVAGIKLAEGASVIAAAVLAADEVENAMVVTSTGLSAKVTPFNLYPAKGRATGGVRSHRFVKGEELLSGAGISVNPIAVDDNGNKIELPAVDKRRDGSGAKLDIKIATVGWA